MSTIDTRREQMLPTLMPHEIDGLHRFGASAGRRAFLLDDGEGKYPQNPARHLPIRPNSRNRIQPRGLRSFLSPQHDDQLRSRPHAAPVPVWIRRCAARLLSHNLREPGDQEGIELIRAAAERGVKLTRQMLAVSRKQRLEPQEVDLNSKIAGMNDLLIATLGGTVPLQTALTADLWPALVDPPQIELVILNLALNARDSMPLGVFSRLKRAMLSSTVRRVGRKDLFQENMLV
jgi:hypothetical protein